jgi:predicted lipid-binding transport protein (Tim44 family)
MKKFLASMMIAVTAMSMVAEATARPLGGNRSIGRQSPTVARQAPSAAPAPAAQRAGAPAPTPATPPKPSVPWKGILGGALLGFGMASLFSHMGMGGAMAGMLSSILMIGLLVMAGLFVYRMFKRKDAPATTGFSGFNQQPAPAGGAPAFQPQAPQQSANAAPATPWGVPGDFDKEGFLRHAKSSFIRMQAAWDKADTNDLREFTTPEVFAELKMQIQERGQAADFTDVVTIDAELLGIETIGDDYLASVKFVGMIKSAPTAAAEPFAEVWNMAKPLNGSTGWVLAGIQQLT